MNIQRFDSRVISCILHCYASSHAITSDLSLQETARAAALFQSDGVIVTGLATGAETNPQEVSGEGIIGLTLW